MKPSSTGRGATGAEGVGAEDGTASAREAQAARPGREAHPPRTTAQGEGNAVAAQEDPGARTPQSERFLPRAITRAIDFFYPPFRRFVPPATFRYAACGGGNVVLSWFLYWFIHNFAIRKRFIDLGMVVVSPHIATLLIVFPITFFLGFWLQRNIAFRSSPLRGATQLGRYALSVAGSLLINYVGLKLLVEALHVYPTPSFMIVTVVTIAYSYFMQHFFTFRGHE